MLFTFVNDFSSYTFLPDPNKISLGSEKLSPTFSHPLGTDDLGRDTLSRLAYGSRVSLTVGFVAAFVALLLGIILGSLAGYFGGLIDQLIMRLADIWMSIPGFILLLTMVAVTADRVPPEQRLILTMVLIGILSWAGSARLVRSEILSIREREFVEAAKAIGCSDAKIISKHILPNLASQLTVQASLFLASAILIEAGLSFLGLGAQPPTASWGNMLTNAQSYLTVAPLLAIFPGIIIFITALSFNFVADAIRDALDPRLRFVRT